MTRGCVGLGGRADTSARSVAAVPARQHGVFTAAQAVEAGFRRDQREFRVRVGGLEVVHSGVYPIAGAPASWRARPLASCWAAPNPALPSQRSAAEIWGLPGGRDHILHVTRPRWE